MSLFGQFPFRVPTSFPEAIYPTCNPHVPVIKEQIKTAKKTQTKKQNKTEKEKMIPTPCCLIQMNHISKLNDHNILDTTQAIYRMWKSKE